jgi:hypothetical protein
MITRERAFEIASQWGSYISVGDLGACFYSFYLNDATPTNPTHQQACIEYTLDLLARVQKGEDRDDKFADRSDLIALLYFFDQAIPLAQDGEDPWEP